MGLGCFHFLNRKGCKRHGREQSEPRKLALHRTSPHPGEASTNLEAVFSDGGEPVGSLTAEKQLLGGDSESGEARILRKSSKGHFRGRKWEQSRP